MINCLIVDDEPFARKIILEFCKHLPDLQVVGNCANALEARNMLLQQPVDILFLDIHMPVLDGLGFLKILENTPQVIFTTAYREYAADAFDAYACDYLVKPFSLERFIIAVNKARKRLHAAPVSPMANIIPEDHFFIKTDGRIYKLQYDVMLYAEAKGNYTKIVTVDKTIMPKMPFSSYEVLLPSRLFIRVHRSFIINRSKISHIEGNVVFVDKFEIPIGSNYKEAFLKTLGL